MAGFAFPLGLILRNNIAQKNVLSNACLLISVLMLCEDNTTQWALSPSAVPRNEWHVLQTVGVRTAAIESQRRQMATENLYLPEANPIAEIKIGRRNS